MRHQFIKTQATRYIAVNTKAAPPQPATSSSFPKARWSLQSWPNYYHLRKTEIPIFWFIFSQSCKLFCDISKKFLIFLAESDAAFVMLLSSRYLQILWISDKWGCKILGNFKILPNIASFEGSRGICWMMCPSRLRKYLVLLQIRSSFHNYI